MSIKFVTSHAESIVSADDIKRLEPQAVAAMETLHNKTGEGSDFLGWVTLPQDYDKEEFARIKKAAEYIKANCDILIVIGIGGSYLGARAVIECLKSPSIYLFYPLLLTILLVVFILTYKGVLN